MFVHQIILTFIYGRVSRFVLKGAEYGINADQKLKIGVDVTWRLLSKVLGDLEFMLDEVDESGKCTWYAFPFHPLYGPSPFEAQPRFSEFYHV